MTLLMTNGNWNQELQKEKAKQKKKETSIQKLFHLSDEEREEAKKSFSAKIVNGKLQVTSAKGTYDPNIWVGGYIKTRKKTSML